MKRPLYDVQQAHADVLMRALAKHNSALDASSTGCGKTLVAADIASRLRRPTIIVCLKGSIPMWKQEMVDRGWPCLAAINYEMLRTGRAEYGDWFLNKQWNWKIPNDSLILWDEVHNCQGINSLNSKMLMGSKRYMNLCLSATAAEDPTEMRALGYILDIHNLRDWYSWCKKQGCKVDPWGKLVFNGSDSVIHALHQQLFPEHGSRLTVADMKDHFQETQIITTPLDFGNEIERLYEEMEHELDDLAAIMKGDSRNPAAEALVAKLRARQKVELLKVPLMIEMTENFIRENRSVVLFVNFDATINALSKRFKDAKIISGKAKEPRHEVEKAFLADQCRIVICNTQAGGTSLSMHDIHGNHPRVAIISPDWAAKKILQTVGRVHRAGGKTPSQQHILFAANTVEVEVKNAVIDGMRRIGIFNDGLPETSSPPNKKVEANPPVCEVKEVTETKIEGEPTVLLNPTPTIAPPEPEHAEYNPSSMKSFEICPGFSNRSGETESSKKGTRIHKALEIEDISKLESDDEKAIAQACKDFTDSVLTEHLPAQPDNDFKEIKLHVDLGNDIQTFGTCDRLIVYGDEGFMFDYKSGWREIVAAEDNPQAWCYVIGAFQKKTLLKKPLEKITFYFLIPNRDEVHYHTFYRKDMAMMQLRINTIIRRAMDADPKQFNPQPELCEYCARQASCPVLAKKALPILSKLAVGLPVPENIIVSKDRPEDIPHLLRLAPIMENFASQIRGAALKLNLEEGVEIAGFKRCERSTPRSVTSVLGAWDALKKLQPKVSFEDFLMACSQVSVPQLEDLVASLAPRNQKGKARRQLENELRGADLLKDQSKVHYLREAKA